MTETPAGEGGHYFLQIGSVCVCVVYVDRVVKAWIRRRVGPGGARPNALLHVASGGSDQVRTHRTSAVISR